MRHVKLGFCIAMLSLGAVACGVDPADGSVAHVVSVGPENPFNTVASPRSSVPTNALRSTNWNSDRR